MHNRSPQTYNSQTILNNQAMCSANDWLQSPLLYWDSQRPSRKSKVRVHCLITRRRYKGKKAKDIQRKNLKLYLENRNILEKNEKLRETAIRLRQENLHLLSEFQKKFKLSQLKTSF